MSKGIPSLFILMIVLLVYLMISACANIQSETGDDHYAGAEQKLVKLTPEPGISQKFILAQPADPKAIAILFPGGRGVLRLSELFGHPVVNELKNNFLVRTYAALVKQGFMVALIDCPDEMISMGGLTAPQRGGLQHRKGVEAVVSYCKDIADVPVWLVGTSAGTVSVANLGISLREKIDGLVFTSSATDMSDNELMSSFKNGIIDFALFMVEDPVLIAAHKDDACKYTPPGKSWMLKARLKNAPKVVVKIYEGGLPPKSDPCEALSQHGFFGIEGVVINDISDFIRTNSSKPVS